MYLPASSWQIHVNNNVVLKIQLPIKYADDLLNLNVWKVLDSLSFHLIKKNLCITMDTASLQDYSLFFEKNLLSSFLQI